jgi:hypothetical protein
MKQPVLKPMQLFAVATVVFFIAYSCNKTPLSSTENLTIQTTSSAKFSSITDITAVNPFNKKVGAPVDGRTGDLWIAKYKSIKGSNTSYTLSNPYIQSIVKQTNCVGICLYYGIDANKKTHILPIGIDINGKKMKCLNVSTIQGNISWETAQQWIANYTGTIKASYLGTNTFERLNTVPCETITVNFSIDDKNRQQLLLSNPCKINLVKQYEDQAVLCPPVCP